MSALAYRRVYRAADPVDAGITRCYLESHGIEVLTLKEGLWGGRGELPPSVDSEPELWVRPGYRLLAERLLAERAARSVETPGDAGNCERCEAPIEPPLACCWRCGAPLP